MARPTPPLGARANPSPDSYRPPSRWQAALRIIWLLLMGGRAEGSVVAACSYDRAASTFGAKPPVLEGPVLRAAAGGGGGQFS